MCDLQTALPPIPQPPQPDDYGLWMWGAIFVATLVFEIWALTTGHRTMSQTVHGRAKWVLGFAFIGLLAHLFL